MYTLPKLSYEYNALEPHFDARTMEIHHTKHHQAYIDKLNAALENLPELAKLPIEELLSRINEIGDQATKLAIRNHGGGHANHTLFWQLLSPESEAKSKAPAGVLLEKLTVEFGGVDQFKEQFTVTAGAHFGSGWAWLVVDDGKFKITSTTNQDSPLIIGQTPILGLDVWEHAYYLHYQNRRSDYIAAFWNIVNWEKVEEFYVAAK